MKFIKYYLAPRLVQYILVTFLGLSAAFFLPRILPMDPVKQQLAQYQAFGVYIPPEQLEEIVSTLQQLYGLEGSLSEQYMSFWKRLFRVISTFVSSIPYSSNEGYCSISPLDIRASPFDHHIELGCGSNSRRDSWLLPGTVDRNSGCYSYGNKTNPLLYHVFIMSHSLCLSLSYFSFKWRNRSWYRAFFQLGNCKKHCRTWSSTRPDASYCRDSMAVPEHEAHRPGCTL